jgi:hypothetical protein
MKQITAVAQFVRVHLATWWPGERKRMELVQQYKGLAANYPLVVADMARRGLAFDNTFDADNPRISDRNQGKREFWLETLALIGTSPEDLQSLLLNLARETEDDD